MIADSVLSILRDWSHKVDCINLHMKEVAGYEFDEEHPLELKEEVVTEEEFEKIEEEVELGENIRFGKRPFDAPIGKVRIWVEEDEPEEEE